MELNENFETGFFSVSCQERSSITSCDRIKGWQGTEQSISKLCGNCENWDEFLHLQGACLHPYFITVEAGKMDQREKQEDITVAEAWLLVQWSTVLVSVSSCLASSSSILTSDVEASTCSSSVNPPASTTV